MEVRIMSVCQPRLSGVHAFILLSKSFLLLCFLTSLAYLLYGRPAWAQQPTGDVDTPVTMTGVLHVVHGDDFDHHRSQFLYHLEEFQTKKHLTFPLCCFDHISCWFPRDTR